MKDKPRILTPVQVIQVVKALLLLGEEHITIETVEKDRYVITTKRNGPNPKEKN
jgi:flagellar biogenesis protein FliO